jgi:uncharacterized protein
MRDYPVIVSEDPLGTALTPKERGVALLRFFIFVGIAAVLIVIALFFVLNVFKINFNPDSGFDAWSLLVVQAVQAILIVLIPTTIMIWACREPSTYFGWGRTKRLRQLSVGVVTGLGLMTTLLLTLAHLGVLHFGLYPRSIGDAITHGLVYAMVFTFTAIAEEGFLRGYGLVQLSRAISFWPAALISSALFGALHLTHATETPLGLCQAGLVGLVCAYSFRRSGALWFAWGLHASWDFVQTFVFGVPDSGMVVPDALMHSTLSGPAWLTGSTAGPEGSLLALPITALAALIAHFTLKPPAS